MSLDDIPKKVQYVILDSNFVTGTNNTFSLDLTLKSNTHVEDMGRVLGIKMVDFYITQVGENDSNLNTNVAKFVDIVCPDIPKPAQILDERHGQVFARVPLERHFAGSNGIVLRDKQWKSFNRHQNYFNPISIKRLDFKIYEQQDDGDYSLLQPDAKWYMVLEITTVNVKEKPKDRELQILQALEKLLKKIDTLNENVQKLPDKPPEENPKKFSFGLLIAILGSLLGGFIWWVNKSSA
jgi:LPS O-antigen subunit length determinant protein (WzzB/FepE family)